MDKEIGSISRLAKKCSACKMRDDCNQKRKEACALMVEPPDLTLPALKDAVQPLMQDLLIKRDYRDIKVGENTTVTIDLEEIKRDLRNQIFAQNLMRLAC